MKQKAIVVKADGGNAVVAVLREEACSHCAGRHICGTAGKLKITVKNPVGAKEGDTVEIENASDKVLGYAALVFLAPVLLAVTMYLLFSRINRVTAVVMTVCGFVLPYIAAFILDRKNRKSRMPVISSVLTDVDGISVQCDNY